MSTRVSLLQPCSSLSIAYPQSGPGKARTNGTQAARREVQKNRGLLADTNQRRGVASEPSRAPPLLGC